MGLLYLLLKQVELVGPDGQHDRVVMEGEEVESRRRVEEQRRGRHGI